MQDVSLRRDEFYLLKNINWNVKRGEHWAVVGLNGSGKTSLLKIITGYILPSNGEVTVLGRKFGAYDLRELRKSIGWVSSSLQDALYPNETVEEIVASGKYASIGLYESPSVEDLNKVSELLNEFGCSSLCKRRYHTLSQGEKQKVILARALMNKPRLLILDEPCTGLDIFARESFLSLVEQIGNAEEAPTLLYVSHHLDEILAVFSHTLLLREGKIYSAGKTKSVLTSQSLSSFYQHEVDFEWRNNRPFIRFNL